MASAATSLVPGIAFSDSKGMVVVIRQADLDEFPDSYLSMLSRRQSGSGTSASPIQVPFSGNTLEMVAQFYETGIWKNPGIFGNKLSISDVSGSFDDICEFLGLPSDTIECDCDDDAPSAWDEMSPEEQQECRAAQAAEELRRALEEEDDFEDDYNEGCDICGSPYCNHH